MKKIMAFVMALASVGLLLARPAFAEGEAKKGEAYDAHEASKLNGETLEKVKTSLAGGLAAAASMGKPISAKFEMHEGKLQLSIYAAKGGKFSEVIVDLVTGKVAAAEPITEGEDFAAAKAQSDALAKAKVSLQSVVRKAMKANKGFRAISVMPSMKDGHPVAEINVSRGDETKTVSEKLD